MWKLQGIIPSTRQAKKLMAVFINKKTDKTYLISTIVNCKHRNYTTYRYVF